MPVDLEFDYEVATSALEFYSETNIKELQEWIQKLDNTTYVPKNLSKKQLLLFYNACDGNMNDTKICIEKYYIYRRNAPEFFNHRVTKSEEFKIVTEICEIFILPDQSNDGDEVIVYRLHDSDSSKYSLESAAKIFLMTVDLNLFKRGPQRSFIFLVDMKGIQFAHLTKLYPTTLRKIFQFIQEAMLLRVKQINIINAESVMEKVLSICKPFMDKELYKMIKIYTKDDNLEKLYKIIPKSSLPRDYGGDVADLQTLHKENIEELKKLETYFKEEEEQRIAALPNETGQNTLEGTFKKLNID